MNKSILVGRLTKDVETRYSQGEESMAITRFTIAVDRKIKREGQPSADFISCVAFGKVGEFINKYFKKGSKIGITGHIQTGSYTNKDGVKVYTTDVIVEEAEFVESKSSAESGTQEPDASGFMQLPEDDEELPFS